MPANGESPTATSPPPINLPKGGGAIRGIGEKFAANPVTGTGSMSVPIATSPGRSGFGPQLSLSYDSGAGNGPFGFGWSLALPQISRKTDKGLPKYNDAEESDVFILSGAEDLVPVLNSDGSRFENTASGYIIHRYRPRIEGLFARIERWTRQSDGETHWRSISKDNILTIYGKDSNSRIFAPANGDPKHPDRVFTWLICETRDDKGNSVLYEYKPEGGAGVDLAQAHERNRGDRDDPRRATNRYLKRILYGNRAPLLDETGRRPRSLTPAQENAGWMFEVVFDYGEHDDANPHPSDDAADPAANSNPWPIRLDPFSTYRAGFEVRTYRLCQRVLMFHHIPDIAADPANNIPDTDGYSGLVRSTDFEYSYEENPQDARNPIYSFLLSVSQSGYKLQRGGDYLKKSLPPIEFTYSDPIIQEEILEVSPESLENLPIGVDGNAYRWTDLHGEGIPGILTEQADAWFYKRNLSPIGRLPVELALLERVASKPNQALATGAQFMDLAGDGQPDLVVMDGVTPGLYEHDTEEGWQPFQPFVARLNRDSRDPNLRLVDLDGDGHADVLITEDDAFVWHPSLGEEGFGPARRVHQAEDEEKGPRLVFADGTQSIYLADFSGDGLTDLVRIRNGEVCYWPNLGYARFGAKITMDGAPHFDHPDQFNQKRIRLADIDGSGTTDIIYLHRDGVRLYFNQSGNSWSELKILSVFPRVNDLVDIIATDLLGNGTACLVWSSPLPGDARRQMRYVDLMGGQKPHLLIKTVNNLGAETLMVYAPSTKFYLQDKRDGKPWITKLPFPVHVVERVETIDRISRNRFVTCHAYHHGFFDGEEREFRGFGMVEQWDTEKIGVLAPEGSAAANAAEASYVPPIHTKTWIHTGDWRPGAEITAKFKEGYWRENNPTGFDLPETVLPTELLTLDDEREACRALRGSVLRQEIYADDAEESASLEDKARARRPYTVSERNYTVEFLQSRGSNRHGVFLVHPRETLEAHHERLENPDPRITHEMILKVDRFGNVEQAVALGYGRKGEPQFGHEDFADVAKWKACQQQTLITLTQSAYTNEIDEADNWRTPLAGEVSTFELAGKGWSDTRTIMDFATVRVALDNKATSVADVDYEAKPDLNTPFPGQKRLIERTRSLYRKDDLTGLLSLKRDADDRSLQPLALPGESYKLALSPGLLDLFADKASRDDLTTLLTAPSTGYRDLDGDGHLWIPSGRVFFSPEESASPLAELAFAREHFFLPHRAQDIFGNSAITRYDSPLLFPAKITDAAQNTTGAIHDYRVLQPRFIEDANGNFTEASYDILGLVAGTAILGKSRTGALGDTLDGFSPDLSDEQTAAFFTHPNPREIAPGLLGKATSRIIYDVSIFQKTFAEHPTEPEKWQPAFAVTLARETHEANLTVATKARVQISFSYSDGLGREIQKKVQAEKGPLVDGGPDITRWVGSGWTIFNNKGKPIRQYEPFFSSTHHFDWGRKVGVSATLFYDPAGRVVATLHPNHTWEKVVFDPWGQQTWDVNDTVLFDPENDDLLKTFLFHGHGSHRLPTEDYLPTWRELRTDPTHAEEANQRWPDPNRLNSEKAAAGKTAVQANTPTVTHFDTLGRPFLVITHNRWLDSNTDDPVEQFASTQTVLDLEGQQLAVKDAKFRTVMAWDYDFLGKPLLQHGMDGGRRWMLVDATNQPLRRWDEREHEFRHEYDDPLHRPTKHLLITRNGPAVCYERFAYGEDVPDTTTENLRGRLWKHHDTAGLVTSGPYDEKGSLLSAKREVCADFKTTPDWNGAPVMEPEAFVTSTVYDALARPTRVTAPDGSVYRPSFNEANLLDKVDVHLRGAATATSFVANIDYDAKGQRTLILYGNGARTAYDYDPLTFRLSHLKTTRPAGLNGLAPIFAEATVLQDLRYTYDPAGNLTRIHDAALKTVSYAEQTINPVCDYTYDALYRLIEAIGREHIGQNAFDFDPPGGNRRDYPFVGHRTHPNDLQALRNYTQRYTYDQVGNFKEGRHIANGGRWTRTYEYEELSLIEGATQTSNRLTRTKLGNGFNRIDDYTHDAHGNMTSMPHLAAMVWAFKDKLQQVELGGGGTAYYVYDAAGQRVRKVIETQSGTRKEERLYLGGFEIFRSFSSDGQSVTLERETLHVMDDKQRIALVETKTLPISGQPLIRYQLGNHLGSASLELAENGEMISYEEYHPYGTTAFQAGRSAAELSVKQYRYTGKERDDETGFSYHGARYYSVWLGRWTSCDPAGMADGANLYAYARETPSRYSDPSGNQSADSTLKLNDVIRYGEDIKTSKPRGLNVQKEHIISQKKIRMIRTDHTGKLHYNPKKDPTVLVETGKASATTLPKPHTQKTFHDRQADVKEIKRLTSEGMKSFTGDIVDPSRQAAIRSGMKPESVDKAIWGQLDELHSAQTLQNTGAELARLEGTTATAAQGVRASAQTATKLGTRGAVKLGTRGAAKIVPIIGAIPALYFMREDIKNKDWENLLYDTLGAVPILGYAAAYAQLQSAANKEPEMTEVQKQEMNRQVERGLFDIPAAVPEAPSGWHNGS